MTEKKLGVFKQAVKASQEASNAIRVETDGIVIHEFSDYESYRDVQIAGNKAKLGRQFVKNSHIEALAQYLDTNYGPVSFGLCHGTRGGREQKWFRRKLTGNPEVIGTEISDTATQFENTVQWDFHDENPKWKARADFVYSNSWDHAYDPKKLFTAWARSLKSGGLMLLDHTKGHRPEAANALDPFGATIEALQALLEKDLRRFGKVHEIIDLSKMKDYPAQVLVWRRN